MRGRVTLFTAMRKEILDAWLAGPWRLTLVACACAKVATPLPLIQCPDNWRQRCR